MVLPKGSEEEEDDDEEEGWGEADGDAGHEANARRMLEREREGIDDFEWK